jgi:hypothetical protein
MSGEVPPFDPSVSDIENALNMDRAINPNEGAPSFIVESAEGVTTFQNFTDEEEPQAAEWLDLKKRMMKSLCHPRRK